MRTTLPILLAAAALATGPDVGRADPALDRAAALHRAGRHAEALAAADAGRAALPPAARLARWAVPFEGRAVPVALVGRAHLVLATEVSRGAGPAPPAGPVIGPALDDGTGGYDFDTLVTGFDATTGRRQWTRRAPGRVDVAVDDRADAVYVWRDRLFRLDPATGATVLSRDLPGGAGALLMGDRVYLPRPGRGLASDDPAARVRAHDVGTGRTVEWDPLTPARLSPDERRVLRIESGFVPGGYGTRVSVRPTRADRPDWSYEHPARSYNPPAWAGEDVVALLGDETGKAEVVRLGGPDGAVRWRFELPRGAYAPGHSQLRGGAYPERTWTALGRCGDHLLALGGEGALYFLDPGTGKLAAKATPAATHLAFPRLVDGALVVCSLDGVRAVPWDVLLRRRAADEGDYAVLRARCLHALGRADEALAELDGLLAVDPDRAGAWAVRAEVARAAGRPFEEIAARCRELELTGRDSSPDLRRRWGLVRRVATGHDLRADVVAAGDAVYAATAAGVVLRIDARSLDVDRSELPGSVARLSGPAGPGARALLYGSDGWRDVGDPVDADRPPPAKAPAAWLATSGTDGPAVRWRGKWYRPLAGGGVRVLDGDRVTEHGPRAAPIRSWRIHVSPWGPPLGYGTGGVYELDDDLRPDRRLIPAPPGPGVWQLTGDARTLGVWTHRGPIVVLQVWDRDGGRMVREQALLPHRPVNGGAEHLTAVGGGYLVAGSEVAWVPGSAAGAAWRFGYGDTPGAALPRLHYAHASLFGRPVVRNGLVFVGCRDGAVYVFDLAAVTGR